jgi:hypothetical protein
MNDGCYRCGQQGHIARECTAVVRVAGACYNCREFGHHSRACPNPYHAQFSGAPLSWDDKDIEEFLRSRGFAVTQLRLERHESDKRPYLNGISSGWGSVTFASRREAERAASELNGAMLPEKSQYQSHVYSGNCYLGRCDDRITTPGGPFAITLR